MESTGKGCEVFDGFCYPHQVWVQYPNVGARIGADVDRVHPLPDRNPIRSADCPADCTCRGVRA